MKLAERPPAVAIGLRVALVDSRPERRQVMRHVVEGGDTGAVVVVEAGTDDAVASVGEHQVDVAVIEIQMPVDDGLRTVAALRLQYPQLGIVVCSFRADADIQQQARLQGADKYLRKPVGRRELNDAFVELVAARGEPIGSEPIDGDPIGGEPMAGDAIDSDTLVASVAVTASGRPPG